jgi:hypothetical protein
MLAQQFELTKSVGSVSADMIGVREPTLAMSIARNNRAGSFIASSLSAIGIFQRRFSILP